MAYRVPAWVNVGRWARLIGYRGDETVFSVSQPLKPRHQLSQPCDVDRSDLIMILHQCRSLDSEHCYNYLDLIAIVRSTDLL